MPSPPTHWRWHPAIALDLTEGHRHTRLTPAEREVARAYTAARRSEFETVRSCASRALADLGRSRPSQPPGARGAPPWPPGVVGSMSHGGGLSLAVVAPVTRLLGLGVDCDAGWPLDDAGAARVLRPDELEPTGDDLSVPNRSRVVFSAKESLYKLWWALRGEHLRFHDVAVTATFDGGLRFRDARMKPGAALPAIADVAGRWSLEGTRVITVTWLESR